MEDSALLEIISSLSAVEVRAARRWLQSPAFTLRAEPLALFNHCWQYQNAGQPVVASGLSKVLNTTDDKRIRREMSELLQHLRDFLAWQEMKKDPVRHEFYQLKSVSRRGLEKNFTLALREAEKTGATVGEAALSRHLIDFQINLEKYHWDLSHRRAQVFPFESLSASLNNWYTGQLLQLTCMAQAQGTVHRTERSESIEWVSALLPVIPGQLHLNTSAVALYHLGYVMLAHPEMPEHMSNFRDLLEKNLENLPTDDARGLLMMAINQGIRSINAGDRDAIRRTMEFYQLGLEKRLLHDESGNLSRYTYNNILMTWLALESWDQARNFLEKYRDDLATGERRNIYDYNLAIYHFRRGEFDQSLDLLRGVSFSDPMYNLESRKMLLKIYFEQGAYDALESLLENMLTWLRRHSELGYHREMYRNLAVFTGRLMRLAPSDKEGRNRLKKKIRETPLVAERNWLLGKM